LQAFIFCNGKKEQCSSTEKNLWQKIFVKSELLFHSWLTLTGNSSILEMNEEHNIRSRLSEGHILFLTRAVAFSAFQKISDTADILAAYVQCGQRQLHERVWCGCFVSGAGVYW
jgi:hypothetical protein